MKGPVLILVGVALVAAFAMPPVSRAAESLDITVCYSGRYNNFHNSKEVMLAAHWAHDGIIMSHGQSKMLDSAVVHCEGVQRGLGPERTGYGLCKIVDDDGDMIIADIPYSWFTYDVKFLEGTGKFKGIKGSLRSERTVRSRPDKGAMPGTYQGCRREKGLFEVSK